MKTKKITCGVFILGLLFVLLVSFPVFAECEDSDGDDPYTTEEQSEVTEETGESCDTDGTMYLVNENYCDGDNTEMTTYYCDSCPPTVCVCEADVTVTSTHADSDGGMKPYVKGSTARYTEVSYSGGILSSGTYELDEDRCEDLKTLREYYISGGISTHSSFTCPGLCRNGVCTRQPGAVGPLK